MRPGSSDHRRRGRDESGSRSALRWWSGAAAAVLLGVLHFATLPIAQQPLVGEMGRWAYYAMRIAQGAVPHRDLFEIRNQLSAVAGSILYRSGEALGVDPLLAIRAGWLALAVVACLLAYAIHARLGRGHVVDGLLGAIAVCSFAPLGKLLSIGNGPKLLMSVLAWVMALLVAQRRWFWAGAAGALAFLDWQIGVLVWVAAFLAAALHGAPRWRAVLAVGLGAGAALLPFAVWYAATGALVEALDQTLVAAFLRGTGRVTDWSDRLGSLGIAFDRLVEGRLWLHSIVALGAVAALWRLERGFRAAEGLLLTPLCVYHFGLCAFFLGDFQARGDRVALAFSLAFFLAVGWTTLADAVRRSPLPGLDAPARKAAVVVLVLLAVVVAGPSPLFPPGTRSGWATTLADQRAFASVFRERHAGQQVLFLGRADLAFLTGHENQLPVLSLSPIFVDHYGRPEEATWKETGARMIRSVDPEIVVVEDRHSDVVSELEGEYRLETMKSSTGRFGASVLVRERPTP